MSETFTSFWRGNRQWLITTLTMVFALGVGYRGISANFERLNERITFVDEKYKTQEVRIAKVEAIISITTQVEINTRRIDQLERFMVSSQTDRAGINTKLDSVKNSLDQLVNMHMKP
jgi:hypothetical protein